MSVLTAILATMDKIDSGYRSSEDAARQAKYQDVPALLLASGDLTFATKLSNAITASITAATPDKLNFEAAQPLLQVLENAYLAKNGYSAAQAKLDAYLSAQNTPAPFQQMVGPNAAYVYWLW